MRGFSRQLLLKHNYLKKISEDELLESVASELDELISLEQFLNIIGIEPKSIKVIA